MRELSPDMLSIVVECAHAPKGAVLHYWLDGDVDDLGYFASAAHVAAHGLLMAARARHIVRAALMPKFSAPTTRSCMCGNGACHDLFYPEGYFDAPDRN